MYIGTILEVTDAEAIEPGMENRSHHRVGCDRDYDRHSRREKSSVPKPQDRLAIGEEHVRQLLPLMATDKHGMVSKQEYMKFMEAEFERLDRSKTGELDVKELTTSANLSASRFAGK